MRYNTSVSLGDYLESFVDNKVLKGRYSSAKEIIRAGLRLLEEKQNKIFVLKKALIPKNIGIAESKKEEGLIIICPKKRLTTCLGFGNHF